MQALRQHWTESADTPPNVCKQADELQALFDAAEAPGDATNAAPRYTLKVLDALAGLGPVRALMAAPPSARLVADPDDAAAVKAAGEPCMHLHLVRASVGASERLLG